MLLALALLLLFVPAAGAASSRSYLERAQNSDGGWGAAPGQGSSQLYTGWAALGLAASGRNPANLKHGGPSPLAFMRSRAGQLNDTGEIERTILVLVAARADPRHFAGRNLVAELERRRRANGSYDGGVVLTAFSVLALKSAGRAGTSGAKASVAWIARQQNSDGGFSVVGKGGQSSADDTASSIQALAVGGRKSSNTVRRAIGFLRRSQNPDGGFPLTQDGPSNAQSTAYAIQGFVAAGKNPAKVRRRGSRSPVAYLRSLTMSNGAVRYSRTSAQTPVWVTGQAAMALSGKSLPLKPLARNASAGGGGGARSAARSAGKDKAAAAKAEKLPPPGTLLRFANDAGAAMGLLMSPLY